MKNISRRVFIKGMAVAAVATAASTVLTGCKLPTTPEEVPTEPASGALSFTDPNNSKNTLKITAKNWAKGSKLLGNEDTVALQLKVENNLGQDVWAYLHGQENEYVVPSSLNQWSTAKDKYYVLATIYMDGYEEREIKATSAGSNPYISSTLLLWNSGSSEVVEDKAYEDRMITIKNLGEDVKKVTVKLEVKKALANGVGDTVATQEFSYTL